ncbi:MAG: hypothetical protein QOF29_4030 [bacterium]
MSYVPWPWTRGARPATRRLARAPVLAAAAAVLAAGALAAPAQAGLAAVGPVNPATGYPDWYQDANGLKLQLCLDGPPSCLAADLTPPEGEAFWWQAESALTLPGGGSARLTLAMEAAFLDNDPITFARIRVTVTGAQPNTTLGVTHPYGSAGVTTDALGNGRFNDDVGCGDSPCAWDRALAGGIGPFLTWAPDGAAAPAGYVGDAVTPHAVVGSPTGFNRFQIGGASTDLFTVQGELAGPPVPVFDGPGAVGFGDQRVGVPVEQTVTVRSLGVPAPDGSSNLVVGAAGLSGPNAAEFAIVGNTCAVGALTSGSTCAITVRFTPGAGGPRSAVLDLAHNAARGAASLALAGTGVPVPAAPPAPPTRAVAGVSAASVLVIRSLRMTHRVSRARIRGRGLRLSMRVPEGTEVVRIAIYRTRGHRRSGPAVFLAHRVPGGAGLFRVRLDSRGLRRRLVPGSYQVNVTPGITRRRLGRTTVTRLRVTRR